MQVFVSMQYKMLHSQCMHVNSLLLLTCYYEFIIISLSFIGKYYYVRHYDKDHSSTMHSILYFTEKHNKDTGSNDCFFVLSSPLNDKEIRKLWNINEIKQCVRTANGITIECCPKCHKKGEIFNRKFTMFMPADRVSSCLRYICKATQFNQTFSNEKKLTGCENDEVHKYCSPAHEYDEVKDNTSEQTISIEPDGYITMRRMDKTMEASSSTSSGMLLCLATEFACSLGLHLMCLKMLPIILLEFPRTFIYNSFVLSLLF